MARNLYLGNKNLTGVVGDEVLHLQPVKWAWIATGWEVDGIPGANAGQYYNETTKEITATSNVQIPPPRVLNDNTNISSSAAPLAPIGLQSSLSEGIQVGDRLLWIDNWNWGQQGVYDVIDLGETGVRPYKLRRSSDLNTFELLSRRWRVRLSGNYLNEGNSASQLFAQSLSFTPNSPVTGGDTSGRCDISVSTNSFDATSVNSSSFSRYNSVVLGTWCADLGVGTNVVFGDNSRVTAGLNSIVLGSQIRTSASNALVVGRNSFNTGDEGQVIGRQCSNTALGGLVVGLYSSNTAAEGMVFGNGSTNTGGAGLVLGISATNSGVDSNVIGKNCNNSGLQSTILGVASTNTQSFAAVVGRLSSNTGFGGCVVGNGSSNTASGGCVFGNTTTNSVPDVTVVGNVAGAVVLGGNATYTATAVTAQISDMGRLITLTNAAAITFTLPTVATAGWPIGAQLRYQQGGAGAVTVSPAGGVTITGAGANTSGQWQYRVLEHIATNQWRRII
jgi:hypothetical protein